MTVQDYFFNLSRAVRLNLPIPDNADDNDSQITFDVIIRAQALGDREALIQSERHVITFDIRSDLIDQLKQITEMI
ncbi:MAG: hypothetical protein U5K00_05815 [Melioribacteraceae bacterium]|nr:hypothetical protein [Melioribacteraceae bacterium]